MVLRGSDHKLMFKLVCVTVIMVILSASGFGATIGYSSSNAGGGMQQYLYTLSGFSLMANQEIALLFDPQLYGTLSNGKAGTAFDLVLLQPNNPTGTNGVYSALALADNPSLAGPFSVQFTYLGSGLAGSQPYQINEYGSNGQFLRTLGTGMTTLASPPPVSVPEPGSVALTAIGVLALGAATRVRYRWSGRASRS
jgi:hypothetical protein